LGGNSLAEILIFGKRAGIASTKYSKNINQQLRSNKTIKFAHENINKFIKNGNELVRPLQHELRKIMWKYCGVVKNKTLLLEGLEKVESIKTQLNEIDVRIDKHNCDDLAMAFNLQSSLISAKATIFSALNRDESRGAHQRSDFPSINPNFQFNSVVIMDQDENLKISKIPLKELNKNLKNIIQNSYRDEDIKDKLLE